MGLGWVVGHTSRSMGIGGRVGRSKVGVSWLVEGGRVGRLKIAQLELGGENSTALGWVGQAAWLSQSQGCAANVSRTRDRHYT